VRDPFEPVEEYLRSRGLRHTEARRTILDAVFGSHEHFTAEMLLEKLKRRATADSSRAASSSAAR
jgi:Fe2+ or Zn2+ uptake regulation protein